MEIVLLELHFLNVTVRESNVAKYHMLHCLILYLLTKYLVNVITLKEKSSFLSIHHQ